jgi:hypothetical protein
MTTSNHHSPQMLLNQVAKTWVQRRFMLRMEDEPNSLFQQRPPGLEFPLGLNGFWDNHFCKEMYSFLTRKQLWVNVCIIFCFRGTGVNIWGLEIQFHSVIVVHPCQERLTFCSLTPMLGVLPDVLKCDETLLPFSIEQQL